MNSINNLKKAAKMGLFWMIYEKDTASPGTKTDNLDKEIAEVKNLINQAKIAESQFKCHCTKCIHHDHGTGCYAPEIELEDEGACMTYGEDL
jgi:hypothetical protein